MASENYITPNIYICKAVYEPRGICYGKVCRKRSMSIRNSGVLSNIRMFVNGMRAETSVVSARQKTDIDVYLSTHEDKPQTVTAFILQDGADPECIKAYPPCSNIEALTLGAKWHRSGDYITAELPLPEHCGVEYFRTDFSDTAVRMDYPSHIGEADGENVQLTFDDGGVVYHKTRLDRQYLVPGYEVSVSFKLAGFDEFQPFAFFRFETNIFTTAKVLGCGLVQKEKVYQNILKPDTSYTYEYVCKDGGEDVTAKPEWIYDTRFRYLIEYRDKRYWLRSSDFASYEAGETVAVIRSTDKMPLTADTMPSNKDVKNTMSEDNDIIVSEHFYGRA
ncbi:MAG: hypothetical protein C0602_12775 [Denitrovibrio sp.]|nr:MAG: hypothetical protein C0602_12775 [Denitrovibrio sp.]